MATAIGATTGDPVGDADCAALSRIAAAIRRRVITLSHTARSAHLGSSLSCVEILAAVFAVAAIRPDNAASSERDRLVMSKGHAAMAFYAALESYGLLDAAALDRYLGNDSLLWGHVTRTAAVPAIDVGTGSLGHGLGLAAGFAYGYRVRGLAGRSFCILSDGECDEGSTWEAALFAGHHLLNGLTAVVDYNKIQSLDRCDAVLRKEPFADKWRSFGWAVREVDGHNVAALRDALRPAEERAPVVVLAHTVKGRGIPRIEDTVASHYHPAQAGDLQGPQS